MATPLTSETASTSVLPGHPLVALPWGGADSGLAYFDATGNLIVLAAQPGDNGQTWNKQLSAVFTKE